MQNSQIPPPPPVGMPPPHAGPQPWIALNQQPGASSPGMPTAGPMGIRPNPQSVHPPIVQPTYTMWKLRKALDPSLRPTKRQGWDGVVPSQMRAAEKELEQLVNKRREATRKTPQEQLAQLTGKTSKGGMQVENFINQMNAQHQEQGSDDDLVLVYCDWQERTVQKRLEIPEITVILKRQQRAMFSQKYTNATLAPAYSVSGYAPHYPVPGQMHPASFQQAAFYQGFQPTAIPQQIPNQEPNVAAKANPMPQQQAPPKPPAAGPIVPPPPPGMPAQKAPKGVVVVQGKGDNRELKSDSKKGGKHGDTEREDGKEIKVEHVTKSTRTITLPKDEPITERLAKTLERGHDDAAKANPNQPQKTSEKPGAIMIPNRPGRRESVYYSRGRRLPRHERLSDETLWSDDGASCFSAGGLTNGSTPPSSPRSPYLEPRRQVVYYERPNKYRQSKSQAHGHPRRERTFLRPPSPPSPLMAPSFAPLNLPEPYYPEDALPFRHSYTAAPEPPTIGHRYGSSARHALYHSSLGYAAPPLRPRGIVDASTPLEPPPVLGDYFERDGDYLARDTGYGRERDVHEYILEGRQRALLQEREREREREELRLADEAAFVNQRRVRELEEELRACRIRMQRPPYPTGY